MRIVFLSYDFGEYSIHHASAMAQDHEVRLILAQELAKPYEKCLDPKIGYRPFKKHRLRQRLRHAMSIRRLRQIDEFQPDVVQDNPLRQQMGLAGKQKSDLEQSPPVVSAETVRNYDRAIADLQQAE